MMILLVDADAMTDLERAMSEEDLVTRAYGKSCFCNKMGGIICPPCAFRPFLSRALAEAHERGRREGLEKAIQTILAEARFQEDSNCYHNPNKTV